MDTLREHGARYAKAVLAASGGNMRQACRTLGITYHTLRGYLGIRVMPGEFDEGMASLIAHRRAIERTRAKLTEAVNILSGLNEDGSQSDA
jgi:hypothetical protein